jgi:acetyltransferase
MSTRNLDALFAPRSIALVGASNQPGSMGQVLTRNLAGGGFAGPLYAVNPHETEVGGLATFHSIAELPQAPDLAVVAIPPARVPELIGQLGERGCRAVVLITAGLSKDPLRQAMLDAARPHLLRIVGPNCLGVLSPVRGINASFAPSRLLKGSLALVAQSGAVTTAALDWATGRGIGFSHVVTLGDMSDVDFGDLLDWLALDPDTSAIVLYIESITQARKFMSAARIAARLKPVVVVKAGRSAAGAAAAFSHTGALAGADLVYGAAFQRAGLLRVGELREMFDAVETLTKGLSVQGDRLMIMTNGGGAGVMAVDALEALGGRLAPLTAQTIETLNARLPATWSHGNPVDIVGDAQPGRFAAALETLLAEPEADAVLVLNCPTALSDGAESARAVIETAEKARPRHPLLSCWLGDLEARQARQAFGAHRIPTYETPEEAVRAFMHLADHHRNRLLLNEAPPTAGAREDRGAVKAVLDAAAAEGRTRLTEPQAKAVLSAYGVPVLESRTAADPTEAEACAAAMTGPYALKILSADISHKSDVGGVVLNLESPAAVRDAAGAMARRVAAAVPGAVLSGFIVQPMAVRPHGRELIIGVSADKVFGPVVLFGQGGVGVEVLADRAIGLPPLNRTLAADMIARTRVSRLLAAYRDLPAVDVDKVSDVLTAVSHLALDFPQIIELDINPLSADGSGVLALDARVRLAGARDQPTPPAIRPYPEALRQTLAVKGGTLDVRPIRPEDAAALRAMIGRADPADVRFRFHAAVRELSQAQIARLTQIDYDREMALIAVMGEEILCVARLVADPEGETAEFALAVRTDQQRRGIGRGMMRLLLDYARQRGIAKVWGAVEMENERMLALGRELGFVAHPSPEQGEVRLQLTL